MGTYGPANEKLRNLEEVEKEIALILQKIRNRGSERKSNLAGLIEIPTTQWTCLSGVLVTVEDGGCTSNLPAPSWRLSKEKPTERTLDRHASQFNASVQRVEMELSSQIRYLTQVLRDSPHEGSSYSARKACQMAVNRVEYTHVKVRDLARTCDQNVGAAVIRDCTRRLFCLRFSPWQGLVTPRGRLCVFHSHGPWPTVWLLHRCFLVCSNTWNGAGPLHNVGGWGGGGEGEWESSGQDRGAASSFVTD
ncbi:LOW QUALITY PROTEIN: mediator of RNA polymerase II transcription subunit 11 [Pristis pectinata]|uniref:LOW QUALITY PROTEIN: mediator of RNA polymerase II transcription subunit 11 n=1 Tax=Pristis pectinata TaxID=685728 RepID=UPI00223CFC79|nr:LOW QUALITY PROTEIN: mediator of RNA polymerase II transcription subunit 11 [Pristis pectinata]